MCTYSLQEPTEPAYSQASALFILLHLTHAAGERALLFTRWAFRMRSSLSTFPDAIRLRENDPQVGNLLCASAWRSVNAPDPLCAVARAPTSSSIPAGVQCERGTTTHTLRAAPTQLSSSRLITSTANCAHCYIRTRTRRRERHAVRSVRLRSCPAPCMPCLPGRSLCVTCLGRVQFPAVQ